MYGIGLKENGKAGDQKAVFCSTEWGKTGLTPLVGPSHSTKMLLVVEVFQMFLSFLVQCLRFGCCPDAAKESGK
jgi:hypothetical protein